MDDAQREIVAFLSDPSSYPPGAGQVDTPVEIIQTHASIVFLAGPRAYKLKRAVKYAYLDFSSPALRRAACTAELKLNRRTAPQLYLEVRAISRGPDGALIWGRPAGDDSGDPLDFVVVMRRFDQRDLLENVAREGGLSLRRLLHSLDTGDHVDPNRITIREWLATWLATVRQEISPKTYEGYTEIVNHFLVPALGNLQLAKLAPAHIQAFYNTWQRAAGVMANPEVCRHRPGGIFTAS